MLVPVTQDIRAGYNAVKNDFELRHRTHIKPADHPNKKLLVVELPQFTVSRMVKDQKKGDYGLCKFAVGAESAREAKKIGDLYQEALNEVFEKGARQIDKTTNEIVLEANRAIVNQRKNK